MMAGWIGSLYSHAELQGHIVLKPESVDPYSGKQPQGNALPIRGAGTNLRPSLKCTQPPTSDISTRAVI